MTRPRIELPDEDPALLAELARLSDEYRRELPGKLAALQEAVSALLAPASGPAGEGRAAAARRALELAHRLSGTARSYGFPAVSDAAADLEDELRVLAASAAAGGAVADPPSPDRGQRVRQLMSNLHELSR
jgi:HPt (histidine-containing phosphotransfer) domain-containing protein